jgi:serine/threonine protein kinase/tetratricopeptide (TPR) repeat protein
MTRKPGDELQAQWISRSKWIDPLILHEVLESYDTFAGPDLCQALLVKNLLSVDQVQQVRYAVQTLGQQQNDQNSMGHSERLRNTLSDSEASQLVGQFLVGGEYEITGVISRGETGVVLEAKQRTWNKTVAIKLMLAHRLTDTRLRRFQREVDLLSSLNHPNIVRVSGCGVEQNLPYFVMDYVSGKTFEQLVAEHLREHSAPPDYDEMARILGSVANALSYCHSQGVIHRDVKASNIVIQGTFEHAVLVDFGVARESANEVGAVSLGASSTGEMTHSLNTMSPEQLDPSEFGILSPAVDVWAFGATLYYGLTGRHPYDAVVATDLLVQINHDKVTRPQELNSNIPRWLNDLCLDCLTIDPLRRPTMQDIADALADDDYEGQAEASLWGGAAEASSIAKEALWPVLALSLVCIIVVLLLQQSNTSIKAAGPDIKADLRANSQQRKLLAALDSGNIKMQLDGLDLVEGWRDANQKQSDLINASLLTLLKRSEGPVFIETMKAIENRRMEGSEIISQLIARLKDKNPEVVSYAIKSLKESRRSAYKPLHKALRGGDEDIAVGALAVLESLARESVSVLDGYDSLLTKYIQSKSSDCRQSAARLTALKQRMDAEAYATRAKQRYKSNQFLAATSDFQLATLLKPKIFDWHVGLAQALMASDKFERAIASLDRAKSIDADDLHIHCLSGSAHFQLERYVRSAKNYSAVIKIDPKHVHAYVDRADCYTGLTKFKEAINDINTVINLVRADAELYAKRASLYLRLNLYEQAEQDYTSAIGLESESPSLYRARAALRYKRKNYRGVAADCAEFNKRQNMTLDLLAMWADSCVQINDIQSAESLYTSIIRMNPLDNHALEVRANLRIRLGSWQDAIDDYTTLMRKGRSSVEIILSRASAFQYLNKLDQAIADCEAARKIDPENKYVYKLYVSVLAGKKNYSEALKMARKSVACDPEDARSHYVLAFIYKQLNKQTLRLEALNNALAIKPNDVQALYQRADLLSKLEKYERSYKDLSKALLESPKNIGCLVLRISVSVILKQHQRALKDAKLLISLSPDNPDTFSVRALVGNSMNDHKATLKNCVRMLQKHPNHVGLMTEIVVSCLGLAEASESPTDKNKYMDQAMIMFEALLKAGQPTWSRFEDSPRFASLRKDSRYKILKQKYQ